jgi:hypothetical protein
MNFIKKLLTVFSIGTFFFVFSSGIISAEDNLISKQSTEINSFELFWPVVAGKTMDDPLYFLKTLKETLRGMLIFGKAQKAEYAVLLSTKRVVEAERLINEGKNDLADKTLEQASVQLDKAGSDLDKASADKISFQNEATDIVNKLSNLENFIPWLISKTDKNHNALIKVFQKVGADKKKLVAPKN